MQTLFDGELGSVSSEARVEVAEDLGPARVLLLSWAGSEVHALVGREHAARPGDRLRPRIVAGRAVVWNGD